jgi:hypothetical protein
MKNLSIARWMPAIIKLAAVTSCVIACAGCVGPVLEMRSAVLAGDSIIVDVKTSTRFGSWEGSGYELDAQWYSLSFPSALTPGPTRPAPRVSPIAWPNELRAAPSIDRFLRTTSPGAIVGPWTAEIVHPIHDGERFDLLRSWTWEELPSPPMAASTDGRYLALLWPSFALVDTHALKPLHDDAVEALFVAAERIPVDSFSRYTLTYNLSYLVVRPGYDGADAGKVPEFTANALPAPVLPKSYSYAKFQLVISKASHSFVAAVPTQFYESVIFPTVLIGIDESIDGQLLLLYRHYRQADHDVEYTIRDQSMHVLHRILLPDSLGLPADKLLSGPEASWDAARHRVLFYVTGTYFESRGNGEMSLKCWDYEAGTSQDIKLDVAGAFRVDDHHYLPKDSETR